MQRVQAILLLLGAPALGAVALGLGLAYLSVTACRPRAGQDPSLEWGSAAAFLACGGFGAAVGAVLGLVAAVRRLRLGGSEAWGAATWVGVALGVAVATAARFSGVLDTTTVGAVFKWWPGTFVFLAALGTVGGVIGGAVRIGPKAPKLRSDVRRVRD